MLYNTSVTQYTVYLEDSLRAGGSSRDLRPWEGGVPFFRRIAITSSLRKGRKGSFFPVLLCLSLQAFTAETFRDQV